MSRAMIIILVVVCAILIGISIEPAEAVKVEDIMGKTMKFDLADGRALHGFWIMPGDNITITLWNYSGPEGRATVLDFNIGDWYERSSGFTTGLHAEFNIVTNRTYVFWVIQPYNGQGSISFDLYDDGKPVTLYFKITRERSSHSPDFGTPGMIENGTRALSENITDLWNVTGRISDNVTDLHNITQDLTNATERLTNSTTILLNTTTFLQENVTDLLKGITDLSSITTNLNFSISGLQNNITALEINVSVLDSYVSSLQSDVLTLFGQDSAMVAQLDTLRDELTSLMAMFETLNSTQQEALSSIADLWAASDILNQTLAILIQEVAQLNASKVDVDYLEEHLTSIASDISSIQSTLATLPDIEADLGQVNDDIARATEDLVALSEDLARVEDSIPDLYDDSVLLERIARLEGQNDLLLQLIADLEDEQDEIKTSTPSAAIGYIALVLGLVGVLVGMAAIMMKRKDNLGVEGE